jgi:hypothetical protein
VIPPDPYTTADFAFVAAGVAVIAVTGVVGALRRQPGPWRRALFVGLGVAVVATALRWWGWRLSLDTSDGSGVLEGSRVEPGALDPYVRDAWIHFGVELLVLGAFAALVRATLRGREVRSASSPE